MALAFGTDGIRGRAHTDLTVDDVRALARAAGAVLGVDTVAIGTDTRESGPAFVDALCAGFADVGVTSWVMGVAPTPAVAHAAARHGVIGAVVSASHNPFHDNGIKFFAPGGRKLTDAQQAALESALAQGVDAVAGAPSPQIIDRHDLVADYVDATIATLEGRDLSGLRIVVDTANGAASAIAADAFGRCGVDVEVICDAPDGRNINEQCGSTDMAGLRAAVVAAGADLGIAFDGDADRVLAVDHHGELVDGDQIIAICALDLAARGALADDTVVVTVMTNLGFRLAMAERGVRVHETPVGDRHVLEALETHSLTLGGEQSGHVIFHELATTGDALLTALQLLDVVRRSGSTLAELADSAMRRLPQRLRNVALAGPASVAMAGIVDAIAAVSADLGESGRLLVRPSGTEPLIRVMAEAPTQAAADAAVDRVIDALQAYAAR